MRKLIYSINMTMDGCCDHTKVNGSEEIHDYFAELLRNGDTLLYGRVTYQLMVPFWPDVAKNRSGPTRSMNDFAQAFDAMREIVVFSRSLERAEGKNTRVIRSNLKEEIVKLKQEEGKDILLGGVDLASQIIALGLVDEYYIVVHPFVVGQGRRLMESVSPSERLALKLIDAKVLASGCVALHYSKG